MLIANLGNRAIAYNDQGLHTTLEPANFATLHNPPPFYLYLPPAEIVCLSFFNDYYQDVNIDVSNDTDNVSFTIMPGKTWPLNGSIPDQLTIAVQPTNAMLSSGPDWQPLNNPPLSAALRCNCTPEHNYELAIITSETNNTTPPETPRWEQRFTTHLASTHLSQDEPDCSQQTKYYDTLAEAMDDTLKTYRELIDKTIVQNRKTFLNALSEHRIRLDHQRQFDAFTSKETDPPHVTQ